MLFFPGTIRSFVIKEKRRGMLYIFATFGFKCRLRGNQKMYRDNTGTIEFPQKIDTNKKKYSILDNFCSFYAILKIMSHIDFGSK